MELSLFLAQLLGLYFLFAGVIFLIRRQSFIDMVKGGKYGTLVFYILAGIELLAGLALVIAHPIYTFNWQGIITFLGGWMIIESVFFMMIPGKMAKRVMKAMNSQLWYVMGALFALILGGYLAGVGFGLF